MSFGENCEFMQLMCKVGHDGYFMKAEVKTSRLV